MVKVSYGTTFWGNEFLEEIYNKTDSNRLSRGKTYANTGKIYNVKLKEKNISARVVGNYSPYYENNLLFSPFSKKQKELILKYIENNPLVLAKITNGILASELLDFIKENSINLFYGFQMDCSCPDFYGAYACKHIAALYFVLSKQIDKDPFILFSLRGLDIVEYFGIKEDIKIPYPFELDYCSTIEESKNIKNIDILKLDNYKKFILSMLESNPAFASVDYKEVLDEFYTKTSKTLPLHISSFHNESISKINRLFSDSKISIRSSKDMSKAIAILENDLFKEEENRSLFSSDKIVFKKNELHISISELFEYFISFEDENGTKAYRYLFYTFRIAYLLLENSAFIPSVIENKDSFHIIYKALLSINIINEQVKILSDISSPILKIDDSNLSSYSQTTFILSLILTEFIPNFKFMHKKQKTNPPAISYSFFYKTPYKIKKFEDMYLAKSIYNYFNIFDIVSSEYLYKIFIDEDKNNFTFSIVVMEKSSSRDLLLKDAIEQFNKLKVVKILSYLDRFLWNIKELLSKKHINLNHKQIEEFLFETSSVISLLGVQIVLPKQLQKLLKPKLSLSATSTSKSHKSFFSLEKMLEYNWQLTIGEEQVSIEEFEQLVKDGTKLIKFKDNFVVIDPNEAKNMFSQLKKSVSLNKYDLLHAKFNNEIFLDKEIDELIEDIFTPKDVILPKNLNANLREYQQRGFAWNINNLLNGFGSILCDDMGLGKTVQAIASLLYLKENAYIKKQILVVVPTSLLLNWENELEKFAPSLSFFSFYGLKRKLVAKDIIITTYDILRRDLEKFKKIQFDCIIIDEAQKIKNSDTHIAKATKTIKAKYKMALSGTPVENNLSELWSIFDFALPHYLKSLPVFTKNYAKDIEINKDSRKINKLKNITAPFMLRRLKSDKNIISDLPDKIVVDEYVNLTKEQASLYKSVVDENLKQLENDNMQGLIFKLIISLKQICNHPRNFDKTSEEKAELSGKSKLLLTLLENIIVQDEKVLIFTQYVQMADILSNIIQKELLSTPLVLKGSMTKKKREEVIHKFQTQSKYKIFILSLKAGGVGLNLTQANHIIHYDLWFNPAVENQATDRAYRIGQNKKVTVHRFISKNSFEEKIDKMIKAKQKLSDLSISVGENWLKDMSKDELVDIFK